MLHHKVSALLGLQPHYLTTCSPFLPSDSAHLRYAEVGPPMFEHQEPEVDISSAQRLAKQANERLPEQHHCRHPQRRLFHVSTGFGSPLATFTSALNPKNSKARFIKLHCLPTLSCVGSSAALHWANCLPCGSTWMKVKLFFIQYETNLIRIIIPQ